MKAHTAGIFQNNIFPSLTAQAKIRHTFQPKGKITVFLREKSY